MIIRRNISKTSASVYPGVPNAEKSMKARRGRRNAFIVSRCSKRRNLVQQVDNKSSPKGVENAQVFVCHLVISK